MRVIFCALCVINLLAVICASDISDKVFGVLDDAIPSAYGDFNSDELTGSYRDQGGIGNIYLPTNNFILSFSCRRLCSEG